MATATGLAPTTGQVHRFAEQVNVTTLTAIPGGVRSSWFTAAAGTEFSYLRMYAPMPGSDSVPEHRILLADGREGYIGQALVPGSRWLVPDMEQAGPCVWFCSVCAACHANACPTLWSGQPEVRCDHSGDAGRRSAT